MHPRLPKIIVNWFLYPMFPRSIFQWAKLPACSLPTKLSSISQPSRKYSLVRLSPQLFQNQQHLRIISNIISFNRPRLPYHHRTRNPNRFLNLPSLPWYNPILNPTNVHNRRPAIIRLPQTSSHHPIPRSKTKIQSLHELLRTNTLQRSNPTVQNLKTTLWICPNQQSLWCSRQWHEFSPRCPKRHPELSKTLRSFA